MERRAAPADELSDVHDNIGDLRDQIEKDLDSDDEKTRLRALAAALIDETTARPGNPYEDRNTKGLLTLQCQDVEFSDGSAILSYEGKSGVEQAREVDDGNVLDVLKEACEDLGPQTEIFQYTSDDGTKSYVGPGVLNDYLREHGECTAKDLRKYHANELMSDVLEEKREEGPNLNQVDDKEEARQEEFDAALEEVADHLGHEKSTLRSDYLLGDFEDTWVDRGDINRKYAMHSMAKRIARRHLNFFSH
jgi:DNA topoisomerase IB